MKQLKSYALNTVRYSALQGEFWMSFCVIFSFASVYLLQKGFTSTQVGTVIAAAGIISAALQPVVGDIVDKSRHVSLHLAITFFSVLIITAALLLYFLKLPFLLTALVYGVMVAFLQVLTPLVNAIGMHYINRGVDVNFGIARGIGSLCYALISLAVGSLVEHYNESVIPLIIIVIYVLVIAAAVTFRFPGAEAKTEETGETEENEKSSAAGPFYKIYPKFMVLLTGLILLFVSHNMLNNFIFQIVQYYGAGSTEMGRVAGLAAVLELPTMFLFTYYLKIMSAGNLLKISGVFFTLKSLVMYLATGMGMIYAAQFAQMFGFALFVVSSVYYVNIKIERQDQVKGQAYMTMTNTIGSVAGSLLGGWLVDAKGVPAMLLVSTIAAIAGTFIVIFSAEGGYGRVRTGSSARTAS
ncbi:MAG TPA: MFS transporter [Lachnospiraceae bacterium]|nr:MFS transporter [Lachnospiraceae bacterium]